VPDSSSRGWLDKLKRGEANPSTGRTPEREGDPRGKKKKKKVDDRKIRGENSLPRKGRIQRIPERSAARPFRQTRGIGIA